MISIHAPREGCDPIVSLPLPEMSIFQSTHPVRGATKDQIITVVEGKFQSTHPVRGATSAVTTNGYAPTYFNPRTP